MTPMLFAADNEQGIIGHATLVEKLAQAFVAIGDVLPRVRWLLPVTVIYAVE
jgi:hypothetical protein